MVKVLEQNLKLEIDASPYVVGTTIKELIALFDMGWRQIKESNSGHEFFVGARTGKVIAIVLMSKK